MNQILKVESSVATTQQFLLKGASGIIVSIFGIPQMGGGADLPMAGKIVQLYLA